MEFIKKYYTKYEEIIKYLFWGVMTTVVNFATFYLLIMCFGSVDGSWNALFNDFGKLGDIIAKIEKSFVGNVCNITAVIVSILFAYVTNRHFVFKDKANGRKAVIKELSSFFACRVFTMVVDSLIYWCGCTVLKVMAFAVKMFSQVVITILNYVFSKLIVFKKKKEEKRD